MDEASSTAATPIDASLLDKLLSNQLSEADARRFVSGDPECTVSTLLALQQRIAASAHTRRLAWESSAHSDGEIPKEIKTSCRHLRR